MGKLDASYSVVVDAALEEVDFSAAKPFLDNPVYAARLVQERSGAWVLIGFVNEVDGQFVGVLSDPIPVTASAEFGLVSR
jgi:beta-fructofuranosidase